MQLLLLQLPVTTLPSFVSRYEQQNIITSTWLSMMIYSWNELPTDCATWNHSFLITSSARTQCKVPLQKQLYYKYDFVGIKWLLPDNTKVFYNVFVSIGIKRSWLIIEFWKHTSLTTILLQISIPNKKVKIFTSS